MPPGWPPRVHDWGLDHPYHGAHLSDRIPGSRPCSRAQIWGGKKMKKGLCWWKRKPSQMGEHDKKPKNNKYMIYYDISYYSYLVSLLCFVSDTSPLLTAIFCQDPADSPVWTWPCSANATTRVAETTGGFWTFRHPNCRAGWCTKTWWPGDCYPCVTCIAPQIHRCFVGDIKNFGMAWYDLCIPVLMTE